MKAEHTERKHRSDSERGGPEGSPFGAPAGTRHPAGAMAGSPSTGGGKAATPKQPRVALETNQLPEAVLSLPHRRLIRMCNSAWLTKNSPGQREVYFR